MSPVRTIQGPLDTDGARRSAESARTAGDDLGLADDDPIVFEVCNQNRSGRAREYLILVRGRPRHGPGTIPSFIVNGNHRCVLKSTEKTPLTRAGEMVHAAVYRLRRLKLALERQLRTALRVSLDDPAAGRARGGRWRGRCGRRGARAGRRNDTEPDHYVSHGLTPWTDPVVGNRRDKWLFVHELLTSSLL